MSWLDSSVLSSCWIVICSHLFVIRPCLVHPLARVLYACVSSGGFLLRVVFFSPVVIWTCIHSRWFCLRFLCAYCVLSTVCFCFIHITYRWRGYIVPSWVLHPFLCVGLHWPAYTFFVGKYIGEDTILPPQNLTLCSPSRPPSHSRFVMRIASLFMCPSYVTIFFLYPAESFSATCLCVLSAFSRALWLLRLRFSSILDRCLVPLTTVFLWIIFVFLCASLRLRMLYVVSAVFEVYIWFIPYGQQSCSLARPRYPYGWSLCLARS